MDTLVKRGVGIPTPIDADQSLCAGSPALPERGPPNTHEGAGLCPGPPSKRPGLHLAQKFPSPTNPLTPGVAVESSLVTAVWGLMSSRLCGVNTVLASPPVRETQA